MTDVLIYWRDYRRIGAMPVTRAWQWHSKAKVLGILQPGDHLWMVTSGENLRQEAKQAAFLVAIWMVKKVITNPNDDPTYPAENYTFRVIADKKKSVVLDPPPPVDRILREVGQDREVSIGRFLQGPRRIKDETLRLLRAAAGPELALRWLTGR